MKRFVSKLTACLMACLMLCTMLPTAFAADDAATALSGDGGTLTDGSYVLEDDVTLTEDLTIPSGVEVTIDLNGHTLTGTGSGSAIAVAGTLTLNDSSDAQSGTVTGGQIRVEGSSSQSASLTMNGGTVTGNDLGYTGNGGGVYVTWGSFTMNGGSITGNAAVSGGGVCVYTRGTFVMNGGSITGNTAYSYGGGVAVIPSSTTGTASTLTLNAGAITDNTASTGGGVYLNYSSSLVMDGGSLYGNTASTSGDDLGIGSSSKSSATLNSTAQFDGSVTLSCGHAITGWYDDSKSSRWSEDNATAADTSAALTSGTSLKAAHAAIAYVASVTSGETVTKYETLQAAIDGATNAGDKVTLLTDVTESVTVAADQTITLDLAGCTLTCASGNTALEVVGNLTLEDSSEAQTGTIYGGRVNAQGESSGKKASFTMNGGTITGSDVGTTGSGGGVYVRYCNFTMNGGLITGNAAAYGAGVYIRSYSTFVMNGGTITGNTAYDYGGGVEVNAGSSSAHKSTFTLNAGTITGNDARIGGGIYLYGYGYLVMNGGYVYNNSSSVSGADIAVASKGHATLNSTEQFDASLTLTDCGHTITGWYDDSRTSRWSETNCTAVDTSEELVSAYYLKAAHGIIKTSEPGIAKTADVTSANAGDSVNYTLTSTVPEDLKSYIDYSGLVTEPGIATASLGEGESSYTLTFVDSMDAGLTLNADSITVKLGDNTLDAGYYTITSDEHSFQVAVDLVALYNADLITESDLGVTDITVTYSATVGSTTGELVNTAYVTYPDGQSATASATVVTYGVKLFKYDQDTNAGLSGATFELKDSDGNVVATLTSGEDGYASYNGLADGTYTLTETSAPDGYVMSDKSLTITMATDATDYVVNVTFANVQVPSTGGSGTTMYTIAGTAILITAAALFLMIRKLRKSDQ
ncbi:MAG: isopeptide-forming domain-containing fimbrial protein [Clostridiales bacterium]|nr:isopeptide-forming domain-containing fimbrial protein [Clostridiales bacterium]